MHTYNNIYKHEISDAYKFTPNDSLLDFFNFFMTRFSGELKLKSSLELGCGTGMHIHSGNSYWEVEGLDISRVAAEHLCRTSDLRVYVADFLNFRAAKSWDLILDAHLLHCLVGVDSFQKYFKNITRHLSAGGHLLLEVMCKSKDMSFDDGQIFDEAEGVLYEGKRASRTILSSKIIEDLILESGLKIVYLRVDEIIKFIPNSYRNECRHTDPDRMRVICLKE